jgi:D-alanyl-D-alanine dipeptidase
MNLSEHLTIAEFEKSNSAGSISNKMNEKEISAAKLLAEKVFEPLRAFRGGPIKVNSGFRSKTLNAKIGGSKTSQHTKGEAIDLPLTSDEFHFIKDNLEFDQLIWEFGSDKKPAWVHVSYSATNNRKQVLRATKVNGKTKYTIF